jgi:hypothetical protein
MPLADIPHPLPKFRRASCQVAYDARFFGTFLPFLRAFDRPMAMACFRFFTLPPLPPRPLLAVPRLYLCISLLTSLPALLEYLRRLWAMLFSL